MPLWSSLKPLLPFSLGLSLELTEHQVPQQSSLTHYPPYHQEVPVHYEHHHQEVPIYHEHHHQEVPVYQEHHHPKPGVCPQPDRDSTTDQDTIKIFMMIFQKCLGTILRIMDLAAMMKIVQDHKNVVI